MTHFLPCFFLFAVTKALLNNFSNNRSTPKPQTNQQAAINMSNRTAGRNVHIYNANDPGTILGGLGLTNGMTNANFYSMVEIILLFDQDYALHNESGIAVRRDDHPLQPGKYFIVTAGSITVSNEAWLVRATSRSTPLCSEEFCQAIRERDRRCIMTGMGARGAKVGYWVGLEAAHVFPLAYERHWAEHNYGHWITIQPGSGGSINSVQNGMLLGTTVYHLFESYFISINPDVCISKITFTFPVG